MLRWNLQVPLKLRFEKKKTIISGAFSCWGITQLQITDTLQTNDAAGFFWMNECDSWYRQMPYAVTFRGLLYPYKWKFKGLYRGHHVVGWSCGWFSLLPKKENCSANYTRSFRKDSSEILYSWTAWSSHVSHLWGKLHAHFMRDCKNILCTWSLWSVDVCGSFINCDEYV